MPYVSGPDALEKAYAVFGDAAGLLRSAARAVEQAGGDHQSGHQDAPGEPEIRALEAFAHDTGLILDAEGIRKMMASDPLSPGIEHQVGVLRGEKRVIKDYDPRLFDPETFEIFYKPTDSLFDYLTDILLANHLFDDDIQLEGFYQSEGNLHIIITQPFIEGRHPDAALLVSKLEMQGMVVGPGPAKFYIDGGAAGRLLVTDLHEDNAILGNQTDLILPIDVHFSFPSREQRIAALKALELY
nr:hypothetical protein [Prosthecobacter debontii]